MTTDTISSTTLCVLLLDQVFHIDADDADVITMLMKRKPSAAALHDLYGGDNDEKRHLKRHCLVLEVAPHDTLWLFLTRLPNC